MFATVVPVPDPGETPADPRRIYIASRHVYQSYHIAFQAFADCDALTMKWFEIDGADRPLGYFRVDPVPIVAMHGHAAPRKLWPRVDRARKETAPDGDAVGGGDDPPEYVGGGVGLDKSDDEGEPIAPIPEAELFEHLLDPLCAAYAEPIALPDPGGGDAQAPIGQESGGLKADDDVASGAPPPVVRAGKPPCQTRRRQVGAAHITVDVPGCNITYWRSNGYFEAACAAHADQRCTLSRRGHSASASSSSATMPGRPLGFLMLWLSSGALCDCKETHKSEATLRDVASLASREYRLESRRFLRHIPGSAELFEHDAPCDDVGIGMEPMQIA